MSNWVAIATRLSPQAGNPDDPLARISDRDEDVPSIVFTKTRNRSLTPFPRFQSGKRDLLHRT